MKKLFFPAAIAAVVAASGVAFSADITGTIKSWDAKTHMLTLDNGKQYMLPSSFKADSFKAGEKVRVAYEEKSGKNEASTATVVK